MNPILKNNVACSYSSNMNQSCNGVERVLEETTNNIIQKYGNETLIGGSRSDKINQLKISGCFITFYNEIHCCLCHRTVAKLDKLKGEGRINLSELHAEGCSYLTRVEKYLSPECSAPLNQNASEDCIGADYCAGASGSCSDINE